jgi:sigma-B regulation protein RsbU (phosphoserine phosphatase)
MRVSTNQRNLPLGVSPSIDPKVSRFTPKKDDILVVVTDGLLEQESESGDVYSLDRVVEILRKHENQAVEILNDRIIDDFETFRGSHHLNDDVTYAIMKFRKQEVVL